LNRDRWDDLTDQDWSTAWETLPEAPELVARPKTAQITLRLPASLVTRIRRVAAARSLPYHALVRSWIVEGLREAAGAEAGTAVDEPQTEQLNIKLEQELLDDLKGRAHQLRRPYHRLARDWIEATVSREEDSLGLNPARTPQPAIRDRVDERAQLTESPFDRKRPLSLALSTWFISHLRGTPPGGLPNDFLRYGAPSLLVFDDLLVDRNAFESEMTFADRWISSYVFKLLDAEGLLRKSDMPTAIPEQALALLAPRANYLIDEELTRLASRTEESVRIPAELLAANRALFDELRLPNALRYDWHEAHMKERAAVLSSSATASTTADREPDVLPILTAILPKFELIPRLTPQQTALMRQNLRDEQHALYRWMYGADTRENYQDFRRTSTFAARDQMIDSDARRRITEENFARLQRVRENSRDLRAGVQEVMIDVITGERTIRDVRTELNQFREYFQSLLPGHQEMVAEVRESWIGGVVAGGGYVTGLAAQLVAHGESPLTPVGLGLGTLGLGLRARQEVKKFRRRRRLRASRRVAPLYWLHREADRARQDPLNYPSGRS
jgi:predicted DNA binding CopG/RHH family protein